MARPPANPELRRLRALAHPTRTQILSLLTGEALTAGEVGKEIGMSQPAASYHIRLLAEVGLITCVAEERVQGGIAKRFRYVPDEKPLSVGVRGDSPTAETQGFRLGQIQALASDLERRVLNRVVGHWSVGDADLWVSDEAWDEFTSGLQTLMETLHERAQPPRASGTVHISATAIAFEQRNGRDGDE